MKDALKQNFQKNGFPFTRSITTWKSVAAHGRHGCIIGTNGAIFGFDTKAITKEANNTDPNLELAAAFDSGKHGFQSANLSDDAKNHFTLIAFYQALASAYHQLHGSNEIIAAGFNNMKREFPNGLDAPLLAISFNNASITLDKNKLKLPKGNIAYIKRGVPFACSGNGHTILVTRPDMIVS
jgi:hypothetical protein